MRTYKVIVPVTFEVEVEVAYQPGRPAPPCSNPSSPAFSDTGDDEELEIIAATVIAYEDAEDAPTVPLSLRGVHPILLELAKDDIYKQLRDEIYATREAEEETWLLTQKEY